MSGATKKTEGRSKVQNEETGMAEPEEGLKSEKEVVLGNISRLPPEIIDHIFKKLDPEDKITLSRACSTWNELFSKKKPVFLFPKVATPLIETFPREALLQCRQLTGSWTQELNEQYQDHPVHFRLRFEISNGKNQVPQLINSFHSAEAIEKFIEDMEAHPGNPFPGRNVTLEFKPPVGLEALEIHLRRLQFCDIACNLMRKFGSHIFYIKFNFDYNGKMRRIEAMMLTSCLIALPNLKRLSIRGGWWSSADEIRDYFTYPILPPLERLEMFEAIYTSPTLANIVLDSCPTPENVKRLSLVVRPSQDFVLPEVAFTFENLELLQAPFQIQDLQRFSTLEGGPAPLKEVHLLPRNGGVQPQEFFRALEPFSNSLVPLMASMMYVYDHVEWGRTEISLPNLETLFLIGFHASLDPFVRLTSLTNWTIVFPEPVNYWNGENRVRFFGFEHHMYDSNIWGLIPSLQTLSIGARKYYRRTFDEIQHRIQNEEG